MRCRITQVMCPICQTHWSSRSKAHQSGNQSRCYPWTHMRVGPHPASTERSPRLSARQGGSQTANLARSAFYNRSIEIMLTTDNLSGRKLLQCTTHADQPHLVTVRQWLGRLCRGRWSELLNHRRCQKGIWHNQYHDVVTNYYQWLIIETIAVIHCTYTQHTYICTVYRPTYCIYVDVRRCT